MILILTDPTAQDYAADYLTHGFASLVGAANVVDFPRKPSLHIGTAEPIFDCDFDLPTAVMNQAEVESALRDRVCDLVVVPTLRGVVPQRLYFWRELLALNADRIVYIDGEDHAANSLPLFVQMAGISPAAYFKRELPPGETWAQPLPFGYPEERIVPVGDRPRMSFVANDAYLWDWCGPDSLRARLRTTLRTAIRPDDGQRWSVTESHRRHRMSALAVSPAGKGFHTNRHLAIVADGCCPVIERPWMQWPDAFVDGVECRYFANEVDCIDIVHELLDQPEHVHAMAIAAQAALRARHTTRCRAETVWRVPPRSAPA